MAKKKHVEAEATDHAISDALHAGHHPVVESGADIDNWTIFGVGLASTFLVVAIVLFVQALDNRMTIGLQSSKGWSTLDQTSYRQDQATHLAGYRWIDRGKGVVAIPLADAKKLTVQRGLPDFPSENGSQPEPEEKPAPAPEAPEEAPTEEGTDAAPDAPEGDAPGEPTPEEPKAPKGPPAEPKGKGAQDGGAEGKGKAPKAPAPPAPAPAPPAPAPEGSPYD